jgi:hypothetical protein
MKYRVEFLDRWEKVTSEMQTDARSAGAVLFQRRVNSACPAHAAGVRVIDRYGIESASRDFVRELYA